MSENTRIVIINMQDAEHVDEAEKHISEYRNAGMIVQQRNLLFDTKGQLWGVVWLEAPVRLLPE